MQTPTELLGPHGPLARSVENFAPRTQQQEMAEAVAEALANYGVLIAEAGPGTGKTFAYLLPALLSGQKVIVSTGTKTLQEQLFYRDLPVVRKALAAPVKVALLKGRANYLCLHRLQLSEAEGRFQSREQATHLRSIVVWAGRTRSGDIAGLSDVPENASIWPQVTSTADNCLGQDCPSFGDCHVFKARKAAQEADILIINHHLFFSDMALRNEGFGELLPGANAVILDEAHQLPELASQFFGTTLGSRQLLDLARDMIAEQIKEGGDMPQLTAAAEQLEKATRDLRLALGGNERRAAWRDIEDDRQIGAAIDTLHQALEALRDSLAAVAERGKGLDNGRARGADLLARLLQFRAAAPDNHIAWFETYTQAFSFNLTPIDISATFRSHLDSQKRAWIFTSATLTVGTSFEHFARQLGLRDVKERRWDSPFDFARQALFYVPSTMPDPSAAEYTATVVARARPVLEESGGRAFLLFTSHRALREAADLLRENLDFPLLVQGSAPRGELLARFRALGNAVLLGTSSFWEGVDVRGAALSCVIIDKLPFASPGDPLVQARIAALRERGGNPFKDYQLPHAVITLKQGVGRLIRDPGDRGVLMVCDPRLLGKPYGQLFLDSLPPMARTRKLDEVREFFALECASVAASRHSAVES